MKKGFTLIELLAVIVILAVIALITTPIIFGIIEKSKKEAARIAAVNYINEVETYMILNQMDSTKVILIPEKKYQVSSDIYKENSFQEEEIYINDLISLKGRKPKSGYIIINTKKRIQDAEFIIDKYNIKCTKNECKLIGISKEEIVEKYKVGSTIEANSIHELLNDNKLIDNGIYTLQLPYLKEIDSTDDPVKRKIEFELYNYNDVTYKESPILCDNSEDSKMCIVKYNNLTINEGVTITPQTRKKGFIISVKNKIINNGNISMSKRGANGVGQNILLFKNDDNSYEYVPAIGANGANTAYSSVTMSGTNGDNGDNRKTGGGGSGAVFKYNLGAGYTGRGQNGTSYSGGSGGGGTALNKSSTWYGISGQVNGGAGGYGRSIRASGSTNQYSGGGGAGNPGGKGQAYDVWNSKFDGENGTGGLLIIYSNKIINNGKIESNGSKGGKGENASLGEAAGGSSGAGSINVFYGEEIIQGNIETVGPKIGNGGAGGNGSITIGTILSGKFKS